MWEAGALAALILSATAGSALADCPSGRFNQVSIVSIAPSPTISSYDPFASGDALVSLSVQVQNDANQSCTAAISMVRVPGSPVMSNGGSTLTYALEPAGGGTSLVTTGFVNGSSPGSANRINLTVPANTTAVASMRIRIPGGQVVAAGNYLDNLVQLIVVALDNSANPVDVKSGPIFNPQATVISKCVMPAPSLSSLDLSPAITNGRPNEGVTRATSFFNVQCTAPTKLRLSGAALQPVVATPPRPGFDNFIDWQAQGTFGGATSLLTTAGATALQADSVQKNVATGATTNGQIDISVGMKNGQPIIAGSYAGTLTVSIDPSF